MSTYCFKPADIVIICESSDLQALSGGLLVDFEALTVTKATLTKFTLADMIVSDPATGVYPLAASNFFPRRLEFEKNAVNPNYEVLSSELKRDSYIHVVPGVIIPNSESDAGKEAIQAFSTRKWVYIYKVAGTNSADDAFHVLGLKKGLQFVVEPTSADLGNRVSGSFRSLAGSGEPNPNGFNFLMTTGIAATQVKFNNRLSVVPIP
jgi:hypothetical protein